MSDEHQKFAIYIDDLVDRADDFVRTAKGCAGLSRKKGEWNRQDALKQALIGLYDENTISAIMVLLKPKPIEYYYSRKFNDEF